MNIISTGLIKIDQEPLMYYIYLHIVQHMPTYK